MQDIYNEYETFEQEVAAYQDLINSGAAWRMEGSIGRQAAQLIEEGYCVLGEVGRNDYYGGYVPSRYEVRPGTKGSVEYARMMHEQRHGQ
jgi:hypothetical protein